MKDPELGEERPGQPPGRAPLHRPGPAPRDLPPLAGDRRRLSRAAGARRRDLAARRRAARTLPPARRAPHRLQLRLPRLPVGARPDAHVDRDGARGPRTGRRAGDVGALEPRRHEARHPLRPRRHLVRVRVAPRGDPDRPRARNAPRPCGGAARDGAARLDVRLPGRGTRAARGRGHPLRPPARPDVAPLGWRRPGPRRLPDPAPVGRIAAAVRLQRRRRRTSMARPARRLGQPHRRARRARTPARCSPCTARASSCAAPRPGRAARRFEWLPADDAVLAFSRGDRFACFVNFGPEPVELPPGADVLIASDELEGGALPQDTTVWLRPAGDQAPPGAR